MHEASLIATWSFALTPVRDAWPALASGGRPMDAVVEISRAIEEDPSVDSVGRGALPDADGNLTLDAMVMSGPEAIGAVAGVQGRMPVIDAAVRVMERTPHILVVGAGADRQADLAAAESGDGRVDARRGDLVTDAARQRWEAWRAAGARDVEDQSRDGGLAPPRPIDRGTGTLFHDGPGGHDTVCVLARGAGADGTLAGGATTSGTPWKVPGRVGDAPIVGHGLYVHPRWGAATVTGSGELAMASCTAFLAVERLRAGDGPVEAAAAALARVLEDHELEAHHQLAVAIMTPDGFSASAAIRPGYRSVRVRGGPDATVEVVAPDVELLGPPVGE
ncbi:MAG: isoaspartyl peptidase/L-asparaginase [Phycisphaerales bacterium]